MPPLLSSPASTPPPSSASVVPLQPLSQSSTWSSAAALPPKKSDMPWKYDGYQSFSRWMASEDDFFLLRRFDSLNAQTILWMQDRITRIEYDLQKIHKDVEDASEDQKWRNDSLRWDEKWMQERHRLIGELSQLLHNYNQYIIAFSKLRARPVAEPRKIKNVVEWLKRGAITSSETTFINHPDLITINHRVLSPLNRIIEHFTHVHIFSADPMNYLRNELPYTLRRFFCRILCRQVSKILPLHQSQSSSNNKREKFEFHSSNSRFELLTNIAVIGTGLLMLLAPMWWLEYVHNSEIKVKVITAFVIVFIGMMSLAVVNRPFEVVAATAAYAAVLMVFMQIDT